MRTFFHADQLLHRPVAEFHRGELLPPFEVAARAEGVLAAVREAGLGPIDEPTRLEGVDHVLAVHQPEFVGFLRTCYDEWRALGRDGDAAPAIWPVRGFRTDRIPASLDGRLSYFSFDMSTPITAGTWAAAKASADIAAACADSLLTGNGDPVFGLCRPPGHHAGFDTFGGYGYLNNAAIVAQRLRDGGTKHVAVLDVDYHHGNGTQSIFYARGDVTYASLHADPSTDYPYFLGYADETGAGEGIGHNHNYPLPRGTEWNAFSAALDAACADVAACDALVVSLGVDTFERDPISAFRLTTDDYLRLGERIAALGKPTAIVLEGGYAIDEIGRNVVHVLRGFTQG